MNKKRRLYWVYSVPEDDICFSERFDKFYQDEIRCRGTMYNGQETSHCPDLKKAFRARGKPLDVEIIHRPRTSTINIGMAEAFGIRNDLWTLLKPHLSTAIVGTVKLALAGKKAGLPYVTVYLPGQLRIDVNRGEDAWHTQCPECKMITPENFSDKKTAVSYTLDDRLVYFSTRDYLLLDGELVDQLDLRRRFPDLRFRRIRIVDEPLDGDVLPGDPGWTGKFTPQDMEAKVASLDRKRRAARRALDLEMKRRVQDDKK